MRHDWADVSTLCVSIGGCGAVSSAFVWTWTTTTGTELELKTEG